MSWPFDLSEPHVTPEALLAYIGRRYDLDAAHLRLPPVLVATFQRAAFTRLVERTAAEVPAALRPTEPAGSVGASGTLAGILVGRLAEGDRPVAVTRLPVGAPATALTLEGAFARGVRTVLVCGSAGSLQPTHPLGSTVVVTEAEREDGTSHHYLPTGETTAADPALSAALLAAGRAAGLAPTPGRAWTIDAPFRETAGAIRRHQAAGVAVVEMEAAAIFAVARVRSARAGLIVAVSDELFHAWNPGFHLPDYLAALTTAADAVLLAAARLVDAAPPPSAAP